MTAFSKSINAYQLANPDLQHGDPTGWPSNEALAEEAGVSAGTANAALRLPEYLGPQRETKPKPSADAVPEQQADEQQAVAPGTNGQPTPPPDVASTPEPPVQNATSPTPLPEERADSADGGLDNEDRRLVGEQAQEACQAAGIDYPPTDWQLRDSLTELCTFRKSDLAQARQEVKELKSQLEAARQEVAELKARPLQQEYDKLLNENADLRQQLADNHANGNPSPQAGNATADQSPAGNGSLRLGILPPTHPDA